MAAVHRDQGDVVVPHGNVFVSFPTADALRVKANNMDAQRFFAAPCFLLLTRNPPASVTVSYSFAIGFLLPTTQ